MKWKSIIIVLIVLFLVAIGAEKCRVDRIRREIYEYEKHKNDYSVVLDTNQYIGKSRSF